MEHHRAGLHRGPGQSKNSAAPQRNKASASSSSRSSASRSATSSQHPLAFTTDPKATGSSSRTVFTASAALPGSSSTSTQQRGQKGSGKMRSQAGGKDKAAASQRRISPRVIKKPGRFGSMSQSPEAPMMPPASQYASTSALHLDDSDGRKARAGSAVGTESTLSDPSDDEAWGGPGSATARVDEDAKQEADENRDESPPPSAPTKARPRPKPRAARNSEAAEAKSPEKAHRVPLPSSSSDEDETAAPTPSPTKRRRPIATASTKGKAASAAAGTASSANGSAPVKKMKKLKKVKRSGFCDEDEDSEMELEVMRQSQALVGSLQDQLGIMGSQERNHSASQMSRKTTPKSAQGLRTCPFCGEEMPGQPTERLLEMMQHYLDRFHRGQTLSSTATLETCNRHREEVEVIPEGKAKGWPTTLDATALRRRILEPDAPYLERMRLRIGQPDSSVFFQEVLKQHSQMGRRARMGLDQMENFTKLQAGYYGEKGWEILRSVIVQNFMQEPLLPSDSLRNDDVLSRIEPLGAQDFVDRVLLPELVCLLIQYDHGGAKEDEAPPPASQDSDGFPASYGTAETIDVDGHDTRPSGITFDEAMQIKEQSARYGIALFPTHGSHDLEQSARDNGSAFAEMSDEDDEGYARENAKRAKSDGPSKAAGKGAGRRKPGRETTPSVAPSEATVSPISPRRRPRPAVSSAGKTPDGTTQPASLAPSISPSRPRPRASAGSPAGAAKSAMLRKKASMWMDDDGDERKRQWERYAKESIKLDEGERKERTDVKMGEVDASRPQKGGDGRVKASANMRGATPSQAISLSQSTDESFGPSQQAENADQTMTGFESMSAPPPPYQPHPVPYPSHPLPPAPSQAFPPSPRHHLGAMTAPLAPSQAYAAEPFSTVPQPPPNSWGRSDSSAGSGGSVVWLSQDPYGATPAAATGSTVMSSFNGGPSPPLSAAPYGRGNGGQAWQKYASPAQSPRHTQMQTPTPPPQPPYRHGSAESSSSMSSLGRGHGPGHGVHPRRSVSAVTVSMSPGLARRMHAQREHASPHSQPLPHARGYGQHHHQHFNEGIYGSSGMGTASSTGEWGPDYGSGVDMLRREGASSDESEGTRMLGRGPH